MRRPMRMPPTRLVWLSLALCFWVGTSALAAEERPQPQVEVHEWSVWVGSPSQVSLNTTRTYRNAMPAAVGTSRPQLDDKESAGKFPIAPISVVQFFGEPYRD